MHIDAAAASDDTFPPLQFVRDKSLYHEHGAGAGVRSATVGVETGAIKLKKGLKNVFDCDEAPRYQQLLVGILDATRN